MNGIEKLYNCATLRGIQPELIHRTIREFDAFISKVIFDYHESPIYEKYHKLIHESKRKDFLEEWIDMFHECCLEEYKWKFTSLKTALQLILR